MNKFFISLGFLIAGVMHASAIEPDGKPDALKVKRADYETGLMASGKESTNQSGKITDLKLTPWQPTTVQILGNYPAPALVSNCEMLTKRNGLQSKDLIAFISKDKSQPYFGPKLDFYIQGSNKIFGFVLVSGGTLIWAEDVRMDGPATFTNTLEITKSATVSININKLVDFYDNKTEATGLNRLFGEWALTEGKYSSVYSQEVKIVEAAVEANLLKIKIENPPSDFHGEAWIDLKTKEVVRAIDAGKVVFPK